MEHRFVAFIDVLGWRNICGRLTSDDAERNRVEDLLGSLRSFSARYNIGLTHTHFSDCLIISGPADGINHWQIMFSAYVQIIAKIYLARGFLVRGAITDGQLAHNESHVYGPALVKAYELESTVAGYPRIILDPDCHYGQFEEEVAVRFVRLGDGDPPRFDVRLAAAEDQDSVRVYRKGYDGINEVDIFEPTTMVFDQLLEEFPELNGVEFLTAFQKAISEQHAKYPTDWTAAGPTSKLYWLITRFNEKLEERGLQDDVKPFLLNKEDPNQV